MGQASSSAAPGPGRNQEASPESASPRSPPARFEARVFLPSAISVDLNELEQRSASMLGQGLVAGAVDTGKPDQLIVWSSPNESSAELLEIRCARHDAGKLLSQSPSHSQRIWKALRESIHVQAACLCLPACLACAPLTTDGRDSLALAGILPGPARSACACVAPAPSTAATRVARGPTWRSG